MIGALLLVLWGFQLGLSGLGLSHSLAGRLLDNWWPLPFGLYAAVTLIRHRVHGRWPSSSLFYWIMLILSAVLLAPNLPVHGVDLGTLVWAAALVAVGVWFFWRPRW